MPKNILIIILFSSILFSNESFGQQVYQLRHYGKPGDMYLYNRMSGDQGVAVLDSGANVTWDLSSITTLNTHLSEIVTPAEGIDPTYFLSICTLGAHSFFDCLEIWNSTEQALLIPDTLQLFQFSLNNLERYQNKTSDLLLENFFGFTVYLQGMNVNAAIVYNTPDTTLKFPVKYGDHWTSYIEWSLDLAATGENVAYSSSQKRTTRIDSWGTLITPYDTFQNIIRLRSEILREDTLITDTAIIPVALTQVEYMWFDTNYTLPIMTANGVATDSGDILAAVQYVYDATCQSPTWTIDTDQDIYYIDSTGAVTVNFIITNSNANEYTWDFGDGSFETTTGNISHTYNLAGSYAVAISGCMTNCLPLNSCSFGIIEFEIQDTLSSGILTPGEEIGIKLFPNPASKSLTIELPEEQGPQQFQILDLSGRKVSEGFLDPGQNKVDIKKLENGAYFLQLWKKGTNRERIFIMRIAVIN